jgi:hypothetical protein
MVLNMEAKTKESIRRDFGGPTGVEEHGTYREKYQELGRPCGSDKSR